MNRIKLLLGAAAVAVLGTSIAPNAHARSTAAWSGRTVNAADGNCVTESYATATNSGCNRQVAWEIPLVVEAAGTWNVMVNVTPTSDPASVSCMAFGMSADASTSWQSPIYPATRGSVSQTLQIMTVHVPGAGSLYAACFLQQGATVNGVNWTQPLQVSLDPQQQSNWCWAAGGEMIMAYLGKEVQQCTQANHRVGRTDCCTNPSACNSTGWPDFGYFGFNVSETSTALSFAQLQAEMAANRPVGFAWAWTGGGGHYMVATGVEVGENNAQFVTINDPWAPNVGDQVTLTYSEWVSSTGHTHMADHYGISKK